MVRKGLFAALGVACFFLGVLAQGCKDNSSNPTGTSGTGKPPTTGSTTNIVMSGSVFVPAIDTVTVGSTVTWKNNDGFLHTATSDGGVWDTGDVGGGATGSATFNTAGTYPYRCTYHASMEMKGTIIVK